MIHLHVVDSLLSMLTWQNDLISHKYLANLCFIRKILHRLRFSAKDFKREFGFKKLGLFSLVHLALIIKLVANETIQLIRRITVSKLR